MIWWRLAYNHDWQREGTLRCIKHNQDQWRKCCICNDMMKVKHNQDQWRKSLCNDTTKVGAQSRSVKGREAFKIKPVGRV